MTMVKKSISVTDKQSEWIRAQIATGYYGNESELVRELIRERQLRDAETHPGIQAIRRKLEEAEKHGFTSQSPEEILADIKKNLSVNGQL